MRSVYVQSASTSVKILSAVVWKTNAIFSASSVDGTNFPISIEFIVCLDTPTFSANSACVKFCFARSTLIEFFIFKSLFPGQV